jgi:hypothetical protein
MKLLLLIACGAPLLSEDITALDGKQYTDVTDVKEKPDGISFSTPTGVVKLKFRNLPEELRKKYHYDPYEEAIYEAKANRPLTLKTDSAYRIAQLEEAKKKAQSEHKPLGFIMVWNQYFDKPVKPMGKGGAEALAHFHEVFHDTMVLVYVFHESELPQIPASVAKGFNGPEEGGFAPNMAVISEDAADFICEIPMGGKDSDGAIREKLFRDKIAVIRKWYADKGGGQAQKGEQDK